MINKNSAESERIIMSSKRESEERLKDYELRIQKILDHETTEKEQNYALLRKQLQESLRVEIQSSIQEKQLQIEKLCYDLADNPPTFL